MHHWRMQAATVLDYTIRLHKRAIQVPKQVLGKLGISKGKTTFEHIEFSFGLPEA